MAHEQTTPWDAAQHLETEADMIARRTGLGRESLYKALEMNRREAREETSAL